MLLRCENIRMGQPLGDVHGWSFSSICWEHHYMSRNGGQWLFIVYATPVRASINQPSVTVTNTSKLTYNKQMLP